MKTIVPTYWKIYAALLVIFASGSTLGYVAGHRVPSAGVALPAEGSAEASSRELWASRALEGLDETLALTPEQREALRPLLEQTGEKIFLQRDRALFRIHLEVLAAHDALVPYLEPEQQKKLVKSKEDMHLSIESRFKFLIDHPVAPSGGQ